ncbi:MAG: NADH-quinone oxidoreductase subunit M [Puniceicoccales bacterium]|jgi:NADH-quinone oxidoreductase subunit M|nr:NADH-quinone oxidoreductase subunit M [Puniceicoccales bacterium]
MPPLATYAHAVLPAALAAPFGTGLVLFLFGRKLPPAVRAFLALAGAVVPVVAAALVWANFGALTNPDSGYACETRLPLGIAPLGIALDLGVNSVSLPLFALAALVGFAAVVTALSDKGAPVERAAAGDAAGSTPNASAAPPLSPNRSPAYLSLLLFMLGGMLGMFAASDLFFLYIFHEFALIPTFLLMLIWGGIGRRTAAIQMAVYLTAGAMVALAGIVLLALKSDAGSFNLAVLQARLSASPAPLDAASANWVFGLLLFGFGILASMFPFHSWAPATYTEAPTPVSMLHAGVLKNFGIYGLLQVALPLAPAGLERWAPVLFWLALGNVVLLGVVTMSQRNLKEMLSYSSVSHIGLCLLGVFAVSLGGGATAVGLTVFLMFATGLSTAALFALSRATQRRCGTLEMNECGGLATRAPVLAAFFVAAGLASAGLPGFANFWAELGVFVSLSKLPVWQLALALSGIVISAVYVLRAAAAVFFGAESEAVRANAPATGGDLRAAERVAAGVLLAVSLAVGFWPRLVTDLFPPAAVAGVTPSAPVPPRSVDAPAEP